MGVGPFLPALNLAMYCLVSQQRLTIHNEHATAAMLWLIITSSRSSFLFLLLVILNGFSFRVFSLNRSFSSFFFQFNLIFNIYYLKLSLFFLFFYNLKYYKI